MAGGGTFGHIIILRSCSLVPIIRVCPTRLPLNVDRNYPIVTGSIVQHISGLLGSRGGPLLL